MTGLPCTSGGGRSPRYRRSRRSSSRCSCLDGRTGRRVGHGAAPA
jgi:hypothetical protein